MRIKYLIAALLIFFVCSGFMFIGGRPPSGGGGLPSGTYILGSDTTYSSSTQWVNGDVAYSRRDGLSASNDVDSGSELVCGIDTSSTAPSNMKIWIADSSGNAISDMVAISPSGDQFNEATVTLSSAITESSIYYVVAIGDGSWQIDHDGSSGFKIINDDTGNYTSPPDPMSTTESLGYGLWGVYAKIP